MTGILKLLEADGVHLKKVSAKEYHSPCPVCGGEDRFVTWPGEGETGRAWCRQCNINMDGIGYLMTVHGITYPEAAEHVGKSILPPTRKGRTGKKRAEPPKHSESVPEVAEPEEIGEPTTAWTGAAERFTAWAADNLRKNPTILDRLRRERGISPETVERWRLGWNPAPLKRSAAMWGLADGELSLPAGLVIPNMRDGKAVSVKIRWESGEPKYHLVRGSKVFPYLLPGDVRGTVAIVESELDALLLWETARDVLTPIAGGGCSNKPPIETVELVARAEILLDCMDNDPAGEQAGAWWKDWFPHSFRWKPTRKDPSEMYKEGDNVRRWIFEGIRAALRELGIYPGRLDFYEAVDILSKPFSREMIQNLSDEEIERLAIMQENGD